MGKHKTSKAIPDQQHAPEESTIAQYFSKRQRAVAEEERPKMAEEDQDAEQDDLSDSEQVSLSPSDLCSSTLPKGTESSPKPPTITKSTKPQWKPVRSETHAGMHLYFDAPVCSASQGESSSEEEDWDLRAYLRKLPTKRDMEQLIQRVEEAHKKEIQEVNANITKMATQIAELEQADASTVDTVNQLRFTNNLYNYKTSVHTWRTLKTDRDETI
ncbi:uncharacterized protein LOC108719972 [Xenopus laevis]|uniref:Uncharacterized protein LOC108719972 n=1 Tax=Xenopus laevis TaxID=8355 RepID=A0A8J0VLW9_XENLA|nr:uncharacterized protein LOC108719972 [Xenopus laevis]